MDRQAQLHEERVQRDKAAEKIFFPQLSTIKPNDLIRTEGGWWLVEGVGRGGFSILTCRSCQVVYEDNPYRFAGEIREIVHADSPDYPKDAEQFVLR